MLPIALYSNFSILLIVLIVMFLLNSTISLIIVYNSSVQYNTHNFSLYFMLVYLGYVTNVLFHLHHRSVGYSYLLHE